MADKNVSEGVSAVDEAELNGYFNTKKEMIYKNIIWDLMNKRCYAKAKTQKQDKMKKGTKKRVVDSKMEDDYEMKKRRLSSKINFDVLEKLINAEPEPEPEPKKPELEEVDKEGCRESENNEENIVEAQSCGEGDEEVEQYENENDEELDYGNMYYGDEDEEGYNYDEDCDYGEY